MFYLFCSNFTGYISFHESLYNDFKLWFTFRVTVSKFSCSITFVLSEKLPVKSQGQRNVTLNLETSIYNICVQLKPVFNDQK